MHLWPKTRAQKTINIRRLELAVWEHCNEFVIPKNITFWISKKFFTCLLTREFVDIVGIRRATSPTCYGWTSEKGCLLQRPNSSFLNSMKLKLLILEISLCFRYHYNLRLDVSLVEIRGWFWLAFLSFKGTQHFFLIDIRIEISDVFQLRTWCDSLSQWQLVQIFDCERRQMKWNWKVILNILLINIIPFIPSSSQTKPIETAPVWVSLKRNINVGTGFITIRWL